MVDSDSVTRLIAAAGEMIALPMFHDGNAAAAREKSPGDVVTEADLAVERFLPRDLRRMLPGSSVVGEEWAASHPDWRDMLLREEAVWLIDPIDGTGNFAAGLPLFTTIVALVRSGQTVMAWIHDPVRGLTATAESGGGAFVSGRRVHVAARKPVASMAGGLHIRLAPDGVRETLARNARAVGSNFEPRGAGVEYLCLAQGQIDFTLFHRVLPWDHAAGVLLCREAGAFAGRLSDGALYRAGDDPWFGSLLVAPDEAAWRELRTALLG